MGCVLSDERGNIIQAVSQKLASTDAFIGEASAALLASWLAASSSCENIFLKGDEHSYRASPIFSSIWIGNEKVSPL